MSDEIKTEDDVAFVEQHLHPNDKVTIIERYVPAEPGDYVPMLFGTWATGFKPMKLVSRKIVERQVSQNARARPGPHAREGE